MDLTPTPDATNPMDLLPIIYSFVLSLGTGAFAINDVTTLSPTMVQVDVQTLGLREDQRYIILVEDGKVTQQARVPLAEAECQNPH